jgi:hypothetical protein
MVLRAVGVATSGLDLVGMFATTRSVWTIDLAFILHEQGLAVTFSTTALGCNQAFEGEEFYTERLRDDRERVEGLFDRALRTGAPKLEQTTVSRDVLARALDDGHAVAIVLVDRRCLYLDDKHVARPAPPPTPLATALTVAAKAVRRFASSAFSLEPVATPSAWESAASPTSEAPAGRRGYTGHYLLVVGVGAHGEVFVRDPASVADLIVALPADEFDRARHSFGTDDDVLLIRDARLPRHLVTRNEG